MIISKDKLKSLVVGQGHVPEEQFNLVSKEAETKDLDLDILLVEKGMIRDETLGQLIADELGYNYVDLKRTNVSEITPRLLSYIPESVAYAQKAVVYEETDEVVKVVTERPDNYNFFKFLEKKIGKKVEAFYVTPFDMDQALKRYKGDLQKEINLLIEEARKRSFKVEENIVKIVDLMMEYAYTNQASDVHIEPLAEFVVLRFRVDGVLHKVAEYPKGLHNRIVSRIKILAELRTDEKAAAQDGRFRFESKGYTIEVRVSIMPIVEGENVVMRLLTQRGKKVTIEELGLEERDAKLLKQNAKEPYGMILVVGPTGSGKTTTLYGVLQLLNRPEVNLMTIEDPVEYNMEGVQQTQVNPAKNMTFPMGLRTIVRQDPDIIMVGEIRDEETVSISINAAMTGHLVLSTLHANDAATTFPRLLDMGAESFLTASSVNVVVAQRLVRKICQECKEKYNLSEADWAKMSEDSALPDLIRKVTKEEDLTKLEFYRGRGCKFCDESGYFDRTAIFEILEVNEAVHNLITAKASAEEIRKQAMVDGMTTMSHDGIIKALAGTTTLEEIIKTIKI